ncbi:DUF624 domain-containing protein [Pseudoflavonifractor phocaeensis]|uniref:DUF624 domain-containing protein n=1 Tax=Pseudoflavonifractor phocaeensis TaxID=1870988 RepID=UPI001F41EC52|nr:DUF624 domain-containing protein [Pseudoflavonifractor phocaeensis]MCF2662584.1 DUF624 domain-containing protein [Pseudoflavonifractor phocaeensis]
MFSSFFNAESPFWRTFTRIMDLFGLSLCWLFCSLPLVTLGASTTALYDAVYHGVRRGESRDYARFFTTFRRELKTSFLVTLPMLSLTAAFLLLYRTAYVMMLAGSQAGGVLFYTYRLLFCIPLAVWLFACALLSRFTFTPGALLRTACQLVFAHLLSAALMIVMVILLLSVVIWWPFSCIFIPATAAWLCSFPLERIFAPFLKKDESGT